MRLHCLLSSVVLLSFVVGCNSPYHRDQLALFGGLSGAGIGAAIGDASGNAGPGAAIGSVIGAVTGAAVGEHIDEVEARNRAMIEAQLGRRLAGATTNQDVIAMSQAGLADDVIITHIRYHGVRQAPTAHDLIALKSSGVSDAVLQAMQHPPAPPAVAVPVSPPPVIVEEHYIHGPPPYRPWRYHHHHLHARRPHGVSWGVSVGH